MPVIFVSEASVLKASVVLWRNMLNVFVVNLGVTASYTIHLFIYITYAAFSTCQTVSCSKILLEIDWRECEYHDLSSIIS